LGLETHLQDLPTDSDGNLLKGNPLGRNIGILNPIKEIFFMGVNLTDKNNVLYDDFYNDLENDWKELFTVKSKGFDKSEHKNCIGADIDGDGFEEIVIVYYVANQQNLQYKVIDRKGQYNLIEGTIANSVVIKENARLSIAKGDINKDSKEEVVIGFDKLYYLVFDEYAKLFGQKTKKNMQPYDIAVGDLNNDGYGEIVATYDEFLEILGHSPSEETAFFKPLYKGAIVNDSASFGWYKYSNKVSVAIGDVDNDGNNDIVFHGRIAYEGFNGYRVMAAHTNSEYIPEWLDFYYTTIHNPDDDDWNTFGRTLAVLDYDGDGKFEIFAHRYLFKYEKGGPDGKNAKKLRTDFPWENYKRSAPKVLATGDVDGDKRDDIVYVNFNHDLKVVGLIECDEGSCRNDYKRQSDRPKGFGEYGVCLANVDDDSPIIKYTGEHEVLFSEPLVLAVMAAPPHYREIKQDKCGGTTYGKGQGITATTTASTGFSFGWSVGVEIEDRIVTQSKFAFEIENKMSFDKYWKHSKTITKSAYRSSAWDQDAVIFTAVPFDVYYYEILAVGLDYPDERIEKGDYLTISVPRKPTILKLSRKDYNDNNGQFPDIDDKILSHTVGDVCSYPRISDIDKIIDKAGYRTNKAESVGKAGKCTTLEIKVDKANCKGESWDTEVTIKSESGSGGVKVGQSTSFNYGFSYEIENTESTIFTGAVGDIIDYEDWQKNLYKWGIAAYPHKFGNQTITVINYWVEWDLCEN
jgi:hypothetical protein